MSDSPEGKFVCWCFKVPEGTIRRAIAEHRLRQVEEVTALTRAAGGCGSCWDDVQRILDETWGGPRPPEAPGVPDPSGRLKKDLIEGLIRQELRPLLERNGLDVQLLDVSGDRVRVRFRGDRVGGTAASYLAVKRHLVRRMSEACGQKMRLMETDAPGQQPP